MAAGVLPEASTVQQPAPLGKKIVEKQAAPDPIEILLEKMTLPEKVGQLFFVCCPEENAVEDVSTYHLGGYIFFGRDFKDSNGNWLTQEQFQQTVQSYQEAAAIPLLIGADEEGGTVIRASRNPNLFPNGKCRSPQWIARNGGDFAGDARNKNSTLLTLGINVNLAPVCDVSTQPGTFIYDRTLGRDAAATAEYVKEVVSAMSTQGIGSVLKHFPGYGNNADTHTGIAVDDRSLEAFQTADFLPFQAGIEAGKEKTAVLVSHNIVKCMDAEMPASLSPNVHRILREELGFDGVVMTDDLAMDAVKSYVQNGTAAVAALQAGNDLLIVRDYRTQIPEVMQALEAGTLEEHAIDVACKRVLHWKQALGLLKER